MTWKVNHVICRLAALAIIATVCGCATMHGMPKQGVSLQLANQSDVGADQVAFDYSVEVRDQWIESNLISIDGLYDDFVTELQKSRNGWSIGAGILDIAFGVASSLTPSAGVKANYAAASTLLTGSYAVINKEVFYEKTVSALVAAMDARRKSVLLQIRTGMQQDKKTYPISAAHEHIRAYQRASSLIGGLSFVEAAASESIKNDESDIAELRPLTDAADRVVRECVTKVLNRLTESEHAKLFSAIRRVDDQMPDGANVSDLLSSIKMDRAIRDDPNHDKKLLQSLSDEGLVKAECGS